MGVSLRDPNPASELHEREVDGSKVAGRNSRIGTEFARPVAEASLIQNKKRVRREFSSLAIGSLSRSDFTAELPAPL